MQLRRAISNIPEWVREHYNLVRRIGIILGIIAAISICLQLLFPTGRILPTVSVGGQDLGGKRLIEANRALTRAYNHATLTVQTDNKKITKTFDEVGIEIKAENTVRAAASYHLWQRLVPFSALYLMATRHTPLQVGYDDERFAYYAAEVQKETFVPAVNATISIKDSSAQLVPSKNSKSYPGEEIIRQLQQITYQPKTVVKLLPKTNPAERTDSEVKSVLNEVNRALKMTLQLNLQGEKITVDSNSISNWLDVAEDAQSKQLHLSLKADVVQRYLDSIQVKIYKAPGTTRILVINGREVGREEGVSGRGIDAEKTRTLLLEALKKGEKSTVDVPVISLAPKIVYDRQYSTSDAGLLSLLSDAVGSKGYGVAVISADGRSANVHGDKKFVAASTYKLFIAYAVFKKIESGQMAWSDTVNGRTVETCFEVMIVRSDNPCAAALAEQIGWKNIENQMHALGLTSTNLGSSRITTANDLALFLYKLQNGSLLSTTDRERLVGYMKRQIYRAGIPAGTGLSVANKPGFIDGYIHDPAIVYAAKGPYILVIMTSGSSWSSIAALAKHVNSFLDQ